MEARAREEAREGKERNTSQTNKKNGEKSVDNMTQSHKT